MNCKIGKLATLVAALAIAFGVARPRRRRRCFTGRVDVTVERRDRRPTAWTSTWISPGRSTRSQVTDTQGQAHFLNLPVGTYAIKASALRLQSVYEPEPCRSRPGRQPLAVEDVAVAGTAETVNVTAARRSSTSSARRRRPTSRSRSCRTSRRRATRGSSCRPCRPSTSIA